MKKQITLFLTTFFLIQTQIAQVGIGTTNPQAQLDVVSSNLANPTNKDGILIPRISAFPTTNPTAAQNGMLVFYTPNNNFYYWDNATTTWLPFVKQIDDLRDGKSKIDGRNLFLGEDAGAAFNTSNRDVIGIGFKALESLTTGNNNLAIGNTALNLTTIGHSNIAVGTFALQNNISGTQNIAIGFESQMNTDARPYNISIGHQSMKSNTAGGQNTALGSVALFNNTEGDYNVAIGASTLYNNTDGDHNLAVGSLSLYSKASGSTNVAIGSNALNKMTSGSNNTAIGVNAMLNFGSGNNNTAIGQDALKGLSAGFSNTSNVAIGFRALSNNTTGSSNTAIGFNSFIRNQTGNSNVVIGNSANIACTTCTALLNTTVVGTNANAQGNNSTAIGSNSLANGINSMAIGYQASVTGDNQIHIGNSSITAIRGQVAFSTYSDKRIKDNVKENVVGLDFIKKLRPVTYNLNVDKQNNLIGISGSDTDIEKYESEKTLRTGFIAQEVEKAAKEVNYNFSGVVKPKSKKELYSLSYAEFVVPLVKATQEQSLIIEKLLKKVETLTKRIEELEQNKK